MRNDQDAVVGTMVGEALQGETNEVISIAGDETAPVASGTPQLLVVRESPALGLMRAHGIDAPAAKELSDARAQVLIEVESHLARLLRRDGRAVSAGWRRATTSAVKDRSRFSRASTSSG